MFNKSSILVTGGTGSFGKKFILHILESYPEVSKIVIFSRDELKQFEMSTNPKFSKYADKLRYFLGDVRDYERLRRAFEDIDYVVHAAALKQVPAAEYNPFEFVRTNVLGAQNIINAALDQNVKKLVALSTDKAAAPVNLYGATKLCSDKLFVAANNMKGKRNISFSVVRYGNVMGSRGSVIPFFMKKKADGVLPITDENMTRFNITLQKGVEFVIDAFKISKGGEIFIPKLPSYRIGDVAAAVAPECPTKIVGIRPGEKLHEEMITSSDSINTYDLGNYFVILPATPIWNLESYIKNLNAKKVTDGFSYSSGKNTEWLSVDELKNLINNEMLA